eukprot:scaffold2224_cov261-Pinguiococcus_pyrenoidosus.AAC.47
MVSSYRLAQVEDLWTSDGCYEFYGEKLASTFFFPDRDDTDKFCRGSQKLPSLDADCKAASGAHIALTALVCFSFLCCVASAIGVLERKEVRSAPVTGDARVSNAPTARLSAEEVKGNESE